MPVKNYKPTSPGIRFQSHHTFDEITKAKPEKALTKGKMKTGGRPADGRSGPRPGVPAGGGGRPDRRPAGRDHVLDHDHRRPASLQLGFHLLKLGPQAIGRCMPMHHELSFPGPSATMDETEELEGLRFPLPSLLSILGGVSPDERYAFPDIIAPCPDCSDSRRQRYDGCRV